MYVWCVNMHTNTCGNERNEYTYTFAPISIPHVHAYTPFFQNHTYVRAHTCGIESKECEHACVCAIERKECRHAHTCGIERSAMVDRRVVLKGVRG